MKALRFNGRSLALDEVAVQKKEQEALIRVSSSGICNTDLEIVRGYAGFTGTIGHEFVGVVEESPEDPALVGKRVVGEINVGCNACDLCRDGDPRHCEKRTVLGISGRDGCHAEFVNLPVRNLIEVPDNVPDRMAVFAEPLAAAYGITQRVEVEPGMTAAVIGDGKLGILCAWSLAGKLQHLYLIGKHQSKLNTAAKAEIEGILLDKAEKLGRRFDIVVEASGSDSGLETALKLLRPKGTLVLKTTIHGKVEWEPWKVVVDEITVVGSRCGRLAPALELLSEGKVDPTPLISEEYGIGEGLRAFESASSPGVMKVLLRM
ncbi:MAG: alcohol dehydrogenase [Acidobacteria bacterium]|nr:MAG: alcohol dehydrogenase [Acidobacteriota bacterium]REJ98896.1 MAG: alcohol dehydrogenase [Acidobacteriota bacterium]REK16384.1 MAG: alcohol dehydrogenase [Acidobacteriota bacterium]REK44065.1 MAG: alcohol dehydrogenase [Acidobacteriota bacterium]